MSVMEHLFPHRLGRLVGWRRITSRARSIRDYGVLVVLAGGILRRVPPWGLRAACLGRNVRRGSVVVFGALAQGRLPTCSQKRTSKQRQPRP